MITAEERRQRAVQHIARIESQIRAIQLWPEEAREKETAFQRWRQQVFARYAEAPDHVLEQRLAEVKAAIRPEVWQVRHGLAYGVCQDDGEWRAVCEAVILEYLLGLFPPGGER